MQRRHLVGQALLDELGARRGLVHRVGVEHRQGSERDRRQPLHVLLGHRQDPVQVDLTGLPQLSSRGQLPQRARVRGEDFVVVDRLPGDRVVVGHVLRVDLDRPLPERLHRRDDHALQDDVVEAVQDVFLSLELADPLVVAVADDAGEVLHALRPRLAVCAAVVLVPHPRRRRERCSGLAVDDHDRPRPVHGARHEPPPGQVQVAVVDARVLVGEELRRGTDPGLPDRVVDRDDLPGVFGRRVRAVVVHTEDHVRVARDEQGPVNICGLGEHPRAPPHPPRDLVTDLRGVRGRHDRRDPKTPKRGLHDHLREPRPRRPVEPLRRVRRGREPVRLPRVALVPVEQLPQPLLTARQLRVAPQ